MDKKISPLHYIQGMTLIELMVVLAIFAIVTSTVLFDYSTYRSKLSLDNLATDIALSIRKAQTYAIGVSGADASFANGYGVHFSTVQEPAPHPNQGSNESFLLFTDVPNPATNPVSPYLNKIYDNPNDSSCSVSTVGIDKECSELLSIKSAVQISAIYLGYADNTSFTVPTGGNIDIVFERPNPDALFCYRPSLGAPCDSQAISKVTIEISNLNPSPTQVNKKDITVWSTGQISVQ